MEPPASARHSFQDAGWYAGRQVDVPTSVPRCHPAWDVLAAFGGLVIRETDPTPGWPPSHRLRFRTLEPYPRITELWSPLLGSPLIGIAEFDDSHGEIYIALNARCFGTSSVHPAFFFMGSTIADAIEGIMTDRRSQPMLALDQDSVTLYGVRFTAESTELYRDW